MAVRLSRTVRDELATMRRRHVLADQQRLKQVLLNLITNAIKYNSESGTVTISAEEIEGHRLRIRVRDTGPGIRTEYRDKLFTTPFRTSRRSSRRATLGRDAVSSRPFATACSRR